MLTQVIAVKRGNHENSVLLNSSDVEQAVVEYLAKRGVVAAGKVHFVTHDRPDEQKANRASPVTVFAGDGLLDVAPHRPKPDEAETPAPPESVEALRARVEELTQALLSVTRILDAAHGVKVRVEGAPRPADPAPTCSHCGLLIGEMVCVPDGRGGYRHVQSSPVCQRAVASAPF